MNRGLKFLGGKKSSYLFMRKPKFLAYQTTFIQGNNFASEWKMMKGKKKNYFDEIISSMTI